MPKGYDKTLHYVVIILAIFGTLMIGSASMGLRIDDTSYSNNLLVKTLVKQIVTVIVGYLAMLVLARSFNIKKITAEIVFTTVALTFISLVACLAFDSVGGAKAWIRFGIGGTEVTIQPSEFAKITTILIISAYCGDSRKQYRSTWDSIKIPAVMILLIGLIVYKMQDDFGSMAVISLIAFVCFQIPANPNMRKFQNLMLVSAFAVLAIVLFVLSPQGIQYLEKIPFLKEYQRNRFISTVDPFYDYYNTGYQLTKGLVSFSRGGWFGTGFGSSISKYSDFPAANTDYILAILVEELGYAGFLGLFLLYGIILVKCFIYALRIRSERARIFLVGTAAYLLAHTLFNVGGVTGMIPLTGVPLLMISSGGSSALSFMMAIGICQSVISSFNNGKLK